MFGYRKTASRIPPAAPYLPEGIPQPRQGRHIPTPGVAQRNPGPQNPQQNKPPNGGDTKLLSWSDVPEFPKTTSTFRREKNITKQTHFKIACKHTFCKSLQKYFTLKGGVKTNPF
jgi:hypothetical protein